MDLELVRLVFKVDKACFLRFLPYEQTVYLIHWLAGIVDVRSRYATINVKYTDLLAPVPSIKVLGIPVPMKREVVITGNDSSKEKEESVCNCSENPHKLTS